MWVAMVMRNAEHAQTILDEWGWTKWLPWKWWGARYLKRVIRYSKIFEESWREILEKSKGEEPVNA